MLSIFAIVQIIGLYVGYQYLAMVRGGEIEPAFKNPESVSNSIVLFLYILLMTGVILLIIKFKKGLLRAVEAAAIFFSSWIVFDFVIPYSIMGAQVPWGLFLALALTAWKMLRPTILSQNVAVILAVSGAGAIIGGSLGVLPVIIFLLLLSIYDFVSVFLTKHMVYMAKAITERPMAFTAAVPVKTKGYSHTFQLGGGDLVMPLILAVSVLGRYGLPHAIFTAVGAFAALGLLFSYVLRNPGQPLPALPPVSAGACLGMLAAVMIFGA